MRLLLPSLALACTDPTRGLPPALDSSTATDGMASASDLVPPWVKTGQEGQIVYRHRAFGGELTEDHRLAAVFGADLQGLIAAPLCALEGLLCTTHLPNLGEVVVDPAPAVLDPEVARFSWMGDSILVDTFVLPFRYQPDVLAAYDLDLDTFPAAPVLSLTMDGEWGPFEEADALPVPAPFELTSPDPTRFVPVSTGSSTTFSWPPAPGDVYVDLLRPDGVHELHRASDDGFTWDARPYLPLGAGEVVTFDLIRVTRRDHDVRGNRLEALAVSQVRLLAGTAMPQSCLGWRLVDASAASGVYTIQPDPAGASMQVWCDMDTDGGGWTQVAASLGAPIRDAAGPWHPGLASPAPGDAAPWVWDGLRRLGAGLADLRFVCHANPSDPAPTVDLSIRDVDWYREITRGSDANSCFQQNDGLGADPPPARRDNVAGLDLPAGDPYAAGTFEGEDSCGAEDDFTVDFDDRGMDSNQSDGTDWGEDDGVPKCGVSGAFGASWRIYVRE